VTAVAAVLAAAAAAYYLLALIAALRWRNTPPRSADLPPVSILKPVRGRDPRFLEAIRSHAAQDYPDFEILFATNDPRDPALDDIRQLAAEFPARSIRVIVSDRKAPNGKVGLLMDLAARARGPVLLINDSDIRVEPDYLRSVVPRLAEPRVGLVTCLYRASYESRASGWEALGIATEFAPSVLVARLLGKADFALGSTMALRAADLDRIGGFEAIQDYLADDYQLGHRIARAGYLVKFAPTVVETGLGGETWADTWRHQLRWARTIRASQPAGYFGYAVTHATLWSLLAMAAGAFPLGFACLTIRMAAGVAVGVRVLNDRAVLRHWYLIPARDLFGFVTWLAGLAGTTVVWRGQKLRVSRDGRIRAA
jgi:ceramide glucosyltransferase